VSSLGRGDALSPFLFNCASEYAIREGSGKPEGLVIKWYISASIYADDVNTFGGSVHIINKNTETLVVIRKEIALKVNAEKTKYVVMFREENAGQNYNIIRNSKSFERVKQFKYLGTILKNQNSFQKEIMNRLESGNDCSQSVRNLWLSKNIKNTIYRTIILYVFYGCETGSLTLREERRLRIFENTLLRRIFGSKRDEVTRE
jgi:hypothetical protein